jgi:hypothetical protein
MRQLTWLIVGGALTLVAFVLLASTEPFAPYVLRDGLLLALVGAALFGWQAPPPQTTFASTVTSGRWLLLSVTGVAALVRLWQLSELPPDCLAAECERALQLDQAPAAFALVDWLARQLAALIEQPLLRLRLASALVGFLTIPVLYLAARRWIAPPGALLAALLLALNPWHLWLSRTGEPWITWPLLILLLVWALAGVSQTKHGLRLYLPLTLLVLALLWREMRGVTWNWGAVDWMTSLTTLLHSPGVASSPLLIGHPLLDPLLATASLLGLGYAARYAMVRGLGALLLGLLVAIGLAVGSAAAGAPDERAWLVLLPWLGLLAALALDAVTTLALQVWRLLIIPARLLTALFVVALVVLGRPTVVRLIELDMSQVAGNGPLAAAMARYLTQYELAGGVDFVPTALIASPTMRLLAGTQVQSGQIQPLEQTVDFLLAGGEPTDLRFLIPGDEPRWLDLLRQLFPDSALESHTDAESGQLLFLVLTVTAQQQGARQGVSSLWTGADGMPTLLALAGPLQFDWKDVPAQGGPFHVEWQGSLLVPLAGNYRFAVDGVAPGEATLTLQLDGSSVLDTTQGIGEQNWSLVKGFYQLTMTYQNLTPSPPAPLTLRWQRPGADWETIPRSVLVHPPLPNIGLVGTYYTGAAWQGLPLDQRKDLLIGPADLPTPYSVQWQGQVAAPRAGEYLFATLADGANQVTIDGQLVIDRGPGEEETSYQEGLIYLTRGWHSLEIRYATTGEQPEFRLLWQPAGAAPAPLSATALSPVLAGALPTLPLPAPLLDPQLGNEGFALAGAIETWQPQVRIPPSNLPLLPFTLLWQTGGGCGPSAGQLNQPQGVALHPEAGQIFVADTVNRRVALYTLDGVAAGVIEDELFQEPYDLQMTADGPVLLDAVAQQLFQLDPVRGVAELLPLSTSFYRSRGFGADPLGNWLVADTGGARIALVGRDGAPIGQFGGVGTPLGKGQPVDALWSNGQLWAISAEDGRLWGLNAGGSLTAVQPTNTLNGPRLAALPTGAFFASDPARAQILYFAPTGQPLGQLSPGVWHTPTGIASVLVGDQVQLAVVDSVVCTLSLWQAPATALPVAP